MSRPKSNDFERFDSLPNAAHVDRFCVARLLNIGVVTLWRRVKDGKVPSPVYFSQSPVWNVGMLRDFIAAN